MTIYKNSGKFKLPVTAIVFHWTGGGSIESTLSHWAKPTTQASAHFIIDRAGKVINTVPIDLIAWHAGKSNFQGKTEWNQFSIGIELVNWGEVFQTAGTQFTTWTGTKIPQSEVGLVTGRYYHLYTPSQMGAAADLVGDLATKIPTLRQVVGHVDISLSGKTDPGPLFPTRKFSGILESRE